jgi:nicotinamidase-related amidase
VNSGTHNETAHRAQMNQALHIEPSSTVALTIDMQRAYLDPVIGDKSLPAAEAEAVMAAASRLLDACRALGIPVVHAYVNRLPVEQAARIGSSRFATISRSIATGGAPESPDRPEGSVQAELMAEIIGVDDIHVKSKKTTDSYHGTELGLLFENAIRPTTVIILGINTETCVHAGVFATKVRGYQPVVAADCVGSHRDPENSELSLELMSRTIAWVMQSEEIIAKLTHAIPDTGAPILPDAAPTPEREGALR